METEKKSNGALLGSIVIIVLLIIGGIYIWQSKVQKALEQKKTEAGMVTPEDANALDALDQDINATDPNVGVDASTIN
ncbi:MAG: hypothetical protein WCS86_02005 [Candidatus Paceibacterota bacterium]